MDLEFGELLQWNVLIPWMLGMVFGVFVGSTPGLTATMAVALIVPFSYHLDPTAGLAMIIGVSFTAIFAGDIPATYLRIPGTPASAAATLDGHELAKRGRGGLALTLDLFCSALGGLVGVLALMTLAPQLARFALHFTDYEYFWLAIAGLSLSALVSQGSLLKGAISAMLGLLLSTIGFDIVTGALRYLPTTEQIAWLPSFAWRPGVAWLPDFSFDLSRAAATVRFDLMEGPQFIPVMIGLFGLAEVLRSLRGGERETSKGGATGGALQIWAALKAIAGNLRLFVQSAVTGCFIGALPGAGADIAAWGAYGLAQKTSRQPETFGTGRVEGVIAPTSANNAAVAGAWIPALVFGVPGDAVTAIVVNAFVTYDIKIGARLFEEGNEQVKSIFAVALLTQLFLLPAGLAGIKLFSLFMRMPREIIMTSVVVFSVVGAFAIRNSMVDVWIMVIFGFVGYYLESRKTPLAPLILGLILGPMIEQKWRVGLVKSGGDISPFFTRGICQVLLAALIFAFLAPNLLRLLRRIQRRSV
ncbi:MAG: tripartite tricarboxylate transporter permease [Pirellulaceae bacterium]|nr:tripartite tricarboxylate transporter permease [Pirellulaceae bacterium]